MSNTLTSKNLDSVTYFKKGTVIFAEGMPSKNLYIIKSGEVRLLKNKNNKLYTLAICRDKEILNEIAILTNTNNSYSAITEKDTEIVMVSEKDISASITSGPLWIEELLGTLCERLVSVKEVVEEHQLQDTMSDKELIMSREQENEYLNLIQVYKTAR